MGRGITRLLYSTLDQVYVGIRAGYDSINQNFLARKLRTMQVLDHISLPLDELRSESKR